MNAPTPRLEEAPLDESMSGEEFLVHLRDVRWRLRNLYWISDKDGKKIKFRPNAVQQRFIDNLWYRNIVLKARQRGYSTVIQIMMLDTCLFQDNVRAAVIAQDETSAEVIFRDKVKFAYDNLPNTLKQANPLTKDSQSELMLSNNSSLRVAISARSGTFQWLHISEFGKICAKRPDAAREIVTGSLPTVDRNGIICIESTAEGAEGYFHDMTKVAEAAAEQGKKLSHLDYRFHFASWWDAPEYEIDPERVIITPLDHAYFERLEVDVGQEISKRKRAWYVVTRSATFHGDDQMMRQEYPSTAKEAFEVSTEGTYYAQQLTAARINGRITTVPYDPRVPVNTFWDIGLNDEMAIWFHQQVGLRDHWIDFTEAAGEPFVYFVRLMQARGYVWGKHFLPHDGDRRMPGAEALQTPADLLAGLGLQNIEIVPRTADVVDAINLVRGDFGSYWFDETRCAEGLKHLGLYRKDWNDRTATWSDRPRHDAHSNAADAFRQRAQARSASIGMQTSTAVTGQRIKRANRSGLAA